MTIVVLYEFNNKYKSYIIKSEAVYVVYESKVEQPPN